MNHTFYISQSTKSHRFENDTYYNIGEYIILDNKLYKIIYKVHTPGYYNEIDYTVKNEEVEKRNDDI